MNRPTLPKETTKQEETASWSGKVCHGHDSGENVTKEFVPSFIYDSSKPDPNHCYIRGWPYCRMCFDIVWSGRTDFKFLHQDASSNIITCSRCGKKVGRENKDGSEEYEEGSDGRQFALEEF